VQVYALAVQSVPVVLFSLAFIALMLVSEFSFHMKLVLGQDSLVPSFSTVMLVRELGPVVTALLLCARIGAGMAAELALMKSTDQLDALRLLGVPLGEYLFFPRWLGSVVACVALTLLALGVSGLSAALFGSIPLHTNPRAYLGAMFLFTHFSDLVAALVKAAVFGTVLCFVAVHSGMQATAGSRGVGDAATRAVVRGSLLIIGADFALTYLFFG